MVNSSILIGLVFMGILAFGCIQTGPQFEITGQSSCYGEVNIAQGCYQTCTGYVKNAGSQAGSAQVTITLSNSAGTQTVKGYSEPVYLNQNEIKSWTVNVDTACGVSYTSSIEDVN